GNPGAVSEVRIDRLRHLPESGTHGGQRGGGDSSRGSGGGGSSSAARLRATKAIAMPIAATTKRNPRTAPTPSASRASARRPADDVGGGGDTFAGSTGIWSENTPWLAFDPAGVTSATRSVSVCSPVPTAKKGGASRTTDWSGPSGLAIDDRPIVMTSPFGRESISSTAAVEAAMSPTFATVTVTWTTSPSYGGIGLTAGFASHRSGATCDRVGEVAAAIPAVGLESARKAALQNHVLTSEKADTTAVLSHLLTEDPSRRWRARVAATQV